MSKDNWINALGELPDNGVNVLAYDAQSKSTLNAYFNGGWMVEGYDDDCCVTHWMHYPDPPTEF